VEEFQKHTAVFVGMTRNSEQFLPQVLTNLDRAAALFKDVSFVFFENDSEDKTKEKLAEWCHTKPKASVKSVDGLSEKIKTRTVRLAHLRNRAIAEVKRNHAQADYLFLIDCDDANARPWNFEALTHALKFLSEKTERAAVFGNSMPDYYDYWALRHPELRPDDVWESSLDDVALRGLTEEAAFKRHYLDKVFNIPETAEPIEVASAFGGLGIYKISSVLKNKAAYVGFKEKQTIHGPIGLSVCEHVSFHAGLLANEEKLFIFPALVNGFHWVQHTIFNPANILKSLVFNIQPIGPAAAPRRNDPCPCGSNKKFKQCCMSDPR